MANTHETRTVQTEQTQTEQTQVEPSKRQVIQFRFVHVVYYILGIIEVLLAFRFVFRLFGANPASPFVTFIYSIARVFMAPFNLIFPTFAEAGIVFEWSVLVAMAVYAVIAVGIVELVNVLTARAPGEHV